MSAIVQSIIATGSSGVIVDIECHLSNNLPTIVIVGFANQAVGESKERIRGAFADSRIILPRKRVTINLAPADIPKADSGFDLAIAVSILAASQQVSAAFTKAEAFIGELGLDGTVRPVRGIIGKLSFGRDHGITTFVIPAANVSQAQLVPNITILPIDSLRQLYDYLRGAITIRPISTGDGIVDDTLPTTTSHNNFSSYFVQVSEVVGQERAKSALLIAAAGGHNVLFNGPPGTGKSMLAKSLQSILPMLSHEEMLEVTHLHSLASNNYEQIISTRPYRAPHHSASQVAITGGGSMIRPGEISLSHRGILFMDELPEFSSTTLEALRQPLEDRIITIARAKETITFPANFILVATSNPCPCGYFGTLPSRCVCQKKQIKHYQGRLSGPIMDRIDLCCNVHEVHHKSLLTTQPNVAADDKARQQVLQARNLQLERYGTTKTLNAAMTNTDIKRFARLSHKAINDLNQAAGSLNLSARAYMRTIKVARTIADLATSPVITGEHITEAISYRPTPPPA